MRKFILFLSFLIILTAPIFASVSYKLEDFKKKYTNASVGVLNYRDQTYGKIGLSPDFYIGPLDLGIDLNLYVAADAKNIIPANQFNWFSFRKFAYEYNDPETTAGIRWERLTNVDYDNGLIMDHYDSGSAGASEFTTVKGGAEVYLKKDFLNVKGMVTGFGIQAVHADYTNSIFNVPVTVGGMYIQDSVGVYDLDNPGTQLRKPQKAYAATLSVPIIKKILNAYTEYGSLINHGNAISFGLGGKWQKIVSYRVEYRNLSKDFVPGYFNTSYQGSYFSFEKSALKSHADGILTYLGVSLIEDYLKTEAVFEAYSNNNPVFSWALGWNKIGPLAGVVNFIKSFQDSNAGIINASISYDQLPGVPFNCEALLFFNRIYKNPNNLSDYDQTIGFSIRPNITQFLKLPYIR
ncbi:MAG: hypothetical protein WC860_08900 [Candidatus Margulisiibacteriota bacterium]|jgi:hypothetical protein